MSREALGRLSVAERTHTPTDSDRLAWLDANQVYLEIGKTGAPGSGYIARDEDGWVVRVKLTDTQTYWLVDTCSTLREAIDALVEALR